MSFKSRITKVDVLRTLRTNLANHIEIYEEAVVGYCKRASQLMADFKKKLDACEPIRLNIPNHINYPESHAEDYERVLRMIELHKDGSIELDENSYNCYMEDNWQWQRRWLSSNSSYSVKAGHYSASKHWG